jgi:hypothetical protein
MLLVLRRDAAKSIDDVRERVFIVGEAAFEAVPSTWENSPWCTMIAMFSDHRGLHPGRWCGVSRRLILSNEARAAVKNPLYKLKNSNVA